MNKDFKTILKENIKEYKIRPMYSAQINKSGCRLVLEMEAEDYRLIENNGESMMLPLNGLILCSGEQKIKIKVYPKEGEEFLSNYARVSLTIYFAEDKSSKLKEYQVITSYKLPKNIAEQNLPYYEGEITYKVKVPFNYSQELEEAVIIEELSNIEHLVLNKYEQLRKLVIDNNNNKIYRLEKIHGSIMFLNSLYADNKAVEKNIKTIYSVVDSRLEEKQVFPIENYDMQFYANGKVVALWQKNLNPSIWVTGKITNSEGFTRRVQDGSATFLYMPKGSTELKVW